MTDALPPVVSDPEVCPSRRVTWQGIDGQLKTLDAPHEWSPVSAGPGVHGEPAYSYKACRYCRGRKP